MSITYAPLTKTLKDRNMNKTQLMKKLGLSSSTSAKMSKNEYVSLKVIESICLCLQCSPNDIFSVVPDVKNLLLDRLKEEKEMKLSGGIYHTTQIDFAYNSNHLEGSKLSHDQTRYIYETNTLLQEGDRAAHIDDIMETVNHFQCFDYLLDMACEELTEDMIKEFHRILKSNTSDSKREWFAVGDYKKRVNIIGDHTQTTPPSKVQEEISNLLTTYNQKTNVSFEDIVEFHYQFERIHPFQDGNGRVGRLIMFKECLKHNIIPFIINDEKKAFYYRGLKEYSEEPGYLTDTCFSAQDEYTQKVEYFGIKEE